MPPQRVLWGMGLAVKGLNPLRQQGFMPLVILLTI